ncbi:unnamed protein product [Rhizoctonia solani]|uniref:DH domain-containing protein n=1 Tax=Rhizoctonia solani TaxID=456999 RepID=A0A8H3AWM9_9AGAM|nr:unnamed protein product [Rhizoctonia solani]
MDSGLYGVDNIPNVRANHTLHHEDGREATQTKNLVPGSTRRSSNPTPLAVKRGIYNLQLHGSRISLISCHHFPLEELIQSFIKEHNAEQPLDSVVVKSAMYGKKLKIPHHEFVVFELGHNRDPSLRNHVILDRNRLDGASILSSVQHSNSAIARDEFRFSCDGNRDKLLRKCDLSPYEAIETIGFPTGDLLPFYELATIALVTSHQRDHYHLLDANCYWFSGLIWEQMLQMYPEAKHEILRSRIRGKFAGLVGYTPNELERDEVGIRIQAMLTEMKTIITGVRRVCETSDSAGWDYVLSAPTPPKLHVQNSANLRPPTLHPSIDGKNFGVVMGGPGLGRSESSEFETDNTLPDTSLPPQSSSSGFSSSTSPSPDRTSTGTGTGTSSRTISQLPLPSTPRSLKSGSPSTRTSASPISLLVEYTKRIYPNKQPDSIPEQCTHALLELLSSERAYAADLALIRDIFIPLAQGKSTQYPLPPSVDSIMLMHKDPPMSAQDVKIVFGNIEEITVFADELSERLEVALGRVVPSGTSDDRVGELFCDLAPRMTPVYLRYITRYPAAVAHYTQLSTNPTPAMAQYLATTNTIASSITDASDIPSLLIKPLERLFKYPLILQTILGHTYTSLNYPNCTTLAMATNQTEQVIRQVNEGKRQWNVTKGVLDLAKSPPRGKQRRFRPHELIYRSKFDHLLALEKRVKECAEGASNMIVCVSTWTNELTRGIQALSLWSRSFQRVVNLDVPLGGDPQGGSNAIRAFSMVAQSLDNLSQEIVSVVQEEIVPQLHRLEETSKGPLFLCAQARAHYNLIHSRDSLLRLEALESYLTLSTQLGDELPQYIGRFERALGIIALRLSNWQSNARRTMSTTVVLLDRSRSPPTVWKGKGKKSQPVGGDLRQVTDRLFSDTSPSAPPSSNLIISSLRQSFDRFLASTSILHPILYAAAAVRPFNPTTSTAHLGLPFLKLEIGDILEILVEAGHPKNHKNLPIPYDYAPDCMLTVRSEQGVKGWVLASYLIPLV